jgi:hypothetical protein
MSDKHNWQTRLFQRLVNSFGTVKAEEMIEGTSKHARGRTVRKDWKAYKKLKRRIANNSVRKNRLAKIAAHTRRAKLSRSEPKQ